MSCSRSNTPGLRRTRAVRGRHHRVSANFAPSTAGTLVPGKGAVGRLARGSRQARRTPPGSRRVGRRHYDGRHQSPGAPAAERPPPSCCAAHWSPPRRPLRRGHRAPGRRRRRSTTPGPAATNSSPTRAAQAAELLTDATTRADAATSTYADAWAAALTAGWTEQQLTSLGHTAPTGPRRRRTTRRQSTAKTSTTNPPEPVTTPRPGQQRPTAPGNS